MIDSELRTILEGRLGADAFARTVDAAPTQRIAPEATPSATWVASQLPLISLPDLEVVGLLGEGGMGKVQLAVQHSLERDVAVKTMHDGATANAATALVREARITGTLEHPGVVPVHVLGLDADGAPLLVMKRIEGVSWSALVAKPDHPGWASRPGDRVLAHLEIMMQICRTVHFAHRRGILHVDIKPANVMVGDFGEVYLVDWGIAQRFDPAGAGTVTLATLMGTPAFMAPEMVSGEPIDVRTDVFLLGATLHAALTGRPRHEGSDVGEVLCAALSPDPHVYAAEIPAELAEICNRATASDPADRFASAEELRVAIAEHLQHRGSIALADRAGERAGALAALLAPTEAPLAPSDLLRAYQLAGESRFGFDLALREWADNRSARAARASFLAQVVELELRQGRVEAAEVILREMDAVSAPLLERVARARTEREQQSQEQARLRALARDLDPQVGAKQRWIAIACFSAGSTAMAAFLFLRGDAVSSSTMLGMSLALLASSLVVTAVLRRKLLENTFNRQLTALFVLAPAGVAVAGVIAFVTGPGPLMTFQFDLLVLLLVSAASAVTAERRFWLMSTVMFVAIIATLVVPERTVTVFALAIGLLPLEFVYAFRGPARTVT